MLAYFFSDAESSWILSQISCLNKFCSWSEESQVPGKNGSCGPRCWPACPRRSRLTRAKSHPASGKVHRWAVMLKSKLAVQGPGPQVGWAPACGWAWGGSGLGKVAAGPQGPTEHLWERAATLVRVAGWAVHVCCV